MTRSFACSRQSLLSRAFVLIIGCLVDGAAVAADITRPDQIAVTAEARSAFERGLAAAQSAKPRWDLAVAAFAAAQREAMAYPPVLLNLGLAHAKAGHEIPAIYWLHAYLVAAPDASNAAQVRDQIARLRASEQAKIVKIFEHALRAAERLPGERSKPEPRKPLTVWSAAPISATEATRARQQQVKDWAFDYINNKYALYYARVLRNIDKALELQPTRASMMLTQYAEFRLAARDIDGALAAVPRLGDADERDALRIEIVKALEKSDRAKESQAIVGSIEKPNNKLRWQFERALLAKDIMQAESVLKQVTDAGIRDESLRALVDFYIDDVASAANHPAARAALGRMTASQARMPSYGLLVRSYLVVGNLDAAREVAAEARNIVRDDARLPAYVQAVLSDRAQLAKLPVVITNLNFLLAFYAYTGQFDEARRLQEAAPRELKGEDRDRWVKEELGTQIFEGALRLRIQGLLAKGDIAQARSLERKLPARGCIGDLIDANRFENNKVLALAGIAEWQIGRKMLDDASRTIDAMQVTNDARSLSSQCVAVKANSLLVLAQAYLAAGQREKSARLANQVRGMVWEGALVPALIDGLARLQDGLGDEPAAAETRSIQPFATLTGWIWRARRSSDDPAATNLAREIEKITSGSGAAGSSAQATAQKVIEKLANLGEHLSDELAFQEVAQKSAAP